MIPIRDDNPTFRSAVVTLGIIALNALAWTLLQGLGTQAPLVRSICELGLTPAELLGRAPPGTHLDIAPGVSCVLSEGSVWHTPFTSMFLHGGWLHLIGNMWFLWIFGNNVEDSMGPVRYAVFYLLCGLAAAALQVGSNPDALSPMVGASGAVGGVMGAYVVLFPRVRVHLAVLLGFYLATVTVPAYFMLGYWLLIQLVGGALDIGSTGGGVAFWAHVGGFLAGALLVFPFRDRALLARHPYHGWRSTAPGRPFERRRGIW